jgi:hypothetical protein
MARYTTVFRSAIRGPDVHGLRETEPKGDEQLWPNLKFRVLLERKGHTP